MPSKRKAAADGEQASGGAPSSEPQQSPDSATAGTQIPNP